MSGSGSEAPDTSSMNSSGVYNLENPTGPNPPPDMSTNDSGEITGVVGGAASGAAIGTAIAPGYGTAIGAVVGAGIGIYGALTSANAQAQIDQEKAALEQAQASEVLWREKENDALQASATFKAEADISSENAGQGHAGGSIGSQLELVRQNNISTALNDQSANFQASMIKAGAGMESQLGSETQQAGYVNAAATGVSLIGKAASPSSGFVNYSTPQNLPAIPEGY